MATPETRWPGTWYRLRVRLPRDREDEAAGIAAESGAIGMETRPAGAGAIDFVCWFESTASARRAAGRFREAGFPAGPEGIVPVRDEGWLEAAAAPRPPIRVGRFEILTEDAGEAAAGSVRVVIPLGRAFGTGEHDTTRLCLELLDLLLPPGGRVLDLGAGSGILAIAAALGGAAEVVAVDNDPRVLDVLARNVARNGVRGVAVVRGTWSCLAQEAAFDLVLANIHRTALVRGARAIGRRIRRGGRAVLSGFPPGDVGEVRAAWAAAGARPLTERRTAEWAAIALEMER